MNDKFEANYEELERIQRIFGEQADVINGINQRVTQRMDELRGGLIGQTADAFFGEMEDEVMPSMTRLADAFVDAETTVGKMITTIADAEQQAANAFRGGGAAGAGGKAGTGGAARGAGNYSPAGHDGEWTGAQIDNANVIFVNGIQTDVGGHMDGIGWLEDKFGKGNVMGVYNDTGGKTNWDKVSDDLLGGVARIALGGGSSSSIATGLLHIGRGVQEMSGFIEDVFQSGNDILESSDLDMRLDGGNPAVDSLEQAIIHKLANGQPVTLVAHSQGGAITSAALQEIKRSHPNLDLSQINLITMGSAGSNYPSEIVSQQHYVTSRDPVPNLVGRGAADVLDNDYQQVTVVAPKPGDAIGHDLENYIKQIKP